MTLNINSPFNNTNQNNTEDVSDLGADRARIKQNHKEILNGLADKVFVDSIRRLIGEIFQPDRNEVLELIVPYTKDITSSLYRLHILNKIKKIHKQDRKEVVRISELCIKGISDKVARYNIITIINETPKQHRKEVQKLIAVYIKDITDGYAWTFITEAIRKNPIQDPQDLVKVLELAVRCINYIKDITDGYAWTFITEAIRKNSIQDFNEILALAVSRINDFFDYNERKLIFTAIARVPSDRKGVVKLAAFLTPQNCKANTIIDILKLVNKNSRIKKTLQRLSTKYASFRDNSIICWQRLLYSSNMNVADVVSTFIVNHFVELGLHDKHSLRQEAIDIRPLLSQESLKLPLNPYTFFVKLKKKRAMKVDFEKIKFNETLEGIEMHLDLKFFKGLWKKNRTHKKISNVTSENLKKMVDTFLCRIKKKQSLNQDIKNMTSMSIQSLLSGSLGGNKGTVHLYNLLDVQQENDKPYHATADQLKCIIKYIESLSTQRLPKECFSEQEGSLIKMLCSIQCCPIGKDGGIKSYFTNIVPVQFKSSLEKKSQNKGTQLLDMMILDEISNMFSGQNSFFKYLIDPDPKRQPKKVKQASHQALYVRNLIGHEVGLPNMMDFDVYTFTLQDKIVGKTKQQVIEVFYRFFSPSFIVTRLKTKINNALDKPNSTVYGQLSKLMKNEQFSTSWAFDSSLGEICITTAGVIHLLSQIGAIKVVTHKK